MIAFYRLAPAPGGSFRDLWVCTLAALLLACTTSRAAPPASGNGLEVSVLRYQGFTGQVSFPELAEDLG